MWLYDISFRLATSMLACLALAGLLYLISPIAPNAESGIDLNSSRGQMYLSAVLFGPLIENAFFSGLVYLAKRVGFKATAAAVTAALLMALLHGLFDWHWGVAIFPLFLILGLTLNAYPQRIRGQISIFTIHALQNFLLISVFFIFFSK